ncbi:MerR family DNA-binding protein [Streptomyces sp. NPDC101234]|uniref:MerR family DNA-binding protein n=1 Tax=Streptomyces sp. NPDC101234 TaxID=3366138 RepID=UPI00382D21C2
MSDRPVEQGSTFRIRARHAFPPETVAWLQYVRTAQALGFSLAEIARNGETLREAPDTAEALSLLFEEKLQAIDTRIAELTTLRADLALRVGTGCPLGPTGGVLSGRTS